MSSLWDLNPSNICKKLQRLKKGQIFHGLNKLEVIATLFAAETVVKPLLVVHRK